MDEDTGLDQLGPPISHDKRNHTTSTLTLRTRTTQEHVPNRGLGTQVNAAPTRET
jgi:hypothetical protein